MSSRKLRAFIREIQYENRNPTNDEVLKLLEDRSTNPEIILKPGTKVYRSRIINDEKAINTQTGFFGYDEDNSFVPPVKLTKDMRANYRYIPYLYCASHPYTSLVEVRPRLGCRVSIATIAIDSEIGLLDFTIQRKPVGMSPPKQNLFADLSELYSKPVTSSDDILDYIPTQYIAEYVKKLGYDGIAFTSSLTPEINCTNPDQYNIVIFHYDKCHAEKSNVFSIDNIYFDCRQIDTDSTKMRVKGYIEENLENV
ncbi:RES family NAD+ phosphorylase [Solibaculum mannosilyticum]|uniref:RES family NAD+ phosphorylase n=1 Tax=Solibaculum mannosilyticum TaxID=2780922 RepID=UPI0007A7FC29|nr:RES domain protein [Eubacteriaceae bacterium CHKCI005]